MYRRRPCAVYPYLHAALANKNVHDSNASRTTHRETPFQTQYSSETPQHKTTAPGHTARARVDHTAQQQRNTACARVDHTADMSLMDLLQDCGDDDDAGSDMDVCIGSDPPAAVPAAVFGGTDSLPAGGTSLAPQEDEAQGAGDEARGAMDGTLDLITNAQSKNGSGGDGVRPLGEAAEQGEAPGTPQRAEGGAPQRAGGGAAGPAPPEASGRTPTAGSPACSAEALSARLAVIPLEGSVDDVAAAVVEACQEFGVVTRRCDSKKSKKEAGGRLVAVGLACKHAMPNRQKEYRQGDAANGAKKRKSSSQRTNCKMKVRLPTTRTWPSLRWSTITQWTRAFVDEVRRQTKPLDTPTKDACGKLTDAGFKPTVPGRMIEALTGERPNNRAIQNHAAFHGRRRTPYDANELLQRVKDATADGGKHLLKMDTEGRMTHIFWMTATQVALSIKYGRVLLYDDIAVKNKYRLPVGIGAVIDGEYFTRVAFHMISSDTQAETFGWVMEAWMETRGGEGPDVFIQDADAACTLAADKVFKGAKKLRCLWHLWKNVKEKLGSILGKDFAAFTHDFRKMRGRLLETGMEESFEELCVNFPKAEDYLRHLYKDRHRWAAAFSVLTFSVSSFTSNRVEGMNRIMKKVCGAMTSLQGVFEFFEGAIEKQEDRALLRAARLALPVVAMAGVDDVWFGKKFMAPIRFGLGMWPFRFMTLEMEAAAIFCGGGDAVLEGDERLEALGKLEFLGELIVGVETVAVVIESRDGRVMRYIIGSMQDGSHICSCRTLQELGLCCRHLWQAMRLSPKFKFHVGMLNRHWLTEQGLRELEAWPPECKPQWMVALVHSDASKDDQVRPPTAVVGDTW
ncbi:unnamed protein product [Pylaiella littoralis]